MADFTCTVCGTPFDANPRVRLWLAGKMRARAFRRVCLCWVCARLAATVDAEAKEMSKALGGEQL